jgi:L-ascorbate metabolism protein UlaG (beta-lactamase superfamily)
MATRLTFLGHATFEIETAGRRLLLDPFLDDNPQAKVGAGDLVPDVILLTHGHFDHVADCVAIAKRTGALVVANADICTWLNRHGVENTHGMNIGGAFRFDFGTVKMTPAHHSSMLPDGAYGGSPAGFLLTLEDGVVYFAGDTGLFSDMQLIGEVGIDLAVLPIGDNFTMGPDDALRAVQILRPKRVVPNHFNTWPPIEVDAYAWAEQVKALTSAEPLVVPPGESVML